LSVEVNSVQNALTAPLPIPPPSAVAQLSSRPSSQPQLVNGVDVDLNDGFTDSTQEQVCEFLCCSGQSHVNLNFCVNLLVHAMVVWYVFGFAFAVIC